MSTSGGSPSITVGGKQAIWMPPEENQGFYAIHKYQMELIKSLVKRLPKEPDKFSAINYSIFGSSVTGLALWVSLVPSKNLPKYLLPITATATILLFIMTIILWFFRWDKAKGIKKDYEELDQVIKDIEKSQENNQNERMQAKPTGSTKTIWATAPTAPTKTIWASRPSRPISPKNPFSTP